MERVMPSLPEGRNQFWSMDFVQDSLADGRRIRVLTLGDNYSRECLALEMGTSLPGARVVRVLNQGDLPPKLGPMIMRVLPLRPPHP